MDRRSFLKASALGAAAVAARPALGASTTTSANVFRHGVASGDPAADAVVLWTRVTPAADALPGSGLGPATAVAWEVASDPFFQHVVRSGSLVTDVTRDHTVSVDVTGLASYTRYWYRFTALGETSPAGRTQTAPAAGEATALRFGVLSCANFEGGWFAAYRHAAERDDVDFLLHLGDYIYEYGNGSYGPGAAIGRVHVPAHEIVTLADYRTRYGCYRTDGDLQEAHRLHPWVVTWDDHEVANDAYADGAENHQSATEGDFLTRRNAAYQAFFEWLPVRRPDPVGAPSRIHRRLALGDLADLHMLDTRQYRDKQTECPALPLPACAAGESAAQNDPARTITGDPQMAWLKTGLSTPGPTWRLIGNQLMIAPVLFPPLPATQVKDVAGLFPADGITYNADQWDGYRADRAELLGHLATNAIDNVVFFTGDIHSSWACDLPLDPGTYPVSPSVAVELVTPSVTSDNLDEVLGVPQDSPPAIAVERAFTGLNRHVRYLEFQRHGYAVAEVTHGHVQMDWWFVSDRTDPAATQSFGAAYAVTAGANAVAPAPAPLGPRTSTPRRARPGRKAVRVSA